MKNMWHLLISSACILCMLIALLLSLGEKPVEYHVFYIQISTDTYGDISPDLIEKHALYEFHFRSDELDRLFATMRDSKPLRIVNEKELNIRVKIAQLNNNKIIYISKSKQVVLGGAIYDIRKEEVNNAIIAITNQALNTKCKDPDQFMCLDDSSYEQEITFVLGRAEKSK